MCRGSESCGEDYVQVCALEHTRGTLQDRFLGGTDGEANGLWCRCASGLCNQA